VAVEGDRQEHRLLDTELDVPAEIGDRVEVEQRPVEGRRGGHVGGAQIWEGSEDHTRDDGP
jgi:hypothetical protein